MAAGDKFDKNNACPQCGSGASYQFHESVCRIDGPAGERHMHRTCGVCHYQWAEKPAV